MLAAAIGIVAREEWIGARVPKLSLRHGLGIDLETRVRCEERLTPASSTMKMCACGITSCSSSGIVPVGHPMAVGAR